MDQSLLESCSNHQAAQLHQTVSYQMQAVNGAADSDSGYKVSTPDGKLVLHNAAREFVPAGSASGGHTSEFSSKENSEFSMSSSDSELGFLASDNTFYSLPVHTDHKTLYHNPMEMRSPLPFPNLQEELQKEAGEERCKVLDFGLEKYEELMGIMNKYKEDLRASELNLQLSQDEVARLKCELQKSEAFAVLARSLQDQLESAQKEIKIKDADLEVERRKVIDLQKQIAEDSSRWQGKLLLAQEETTMVTAELNSLRADHENLSVEKTHLRSEMSNLLEKQKTLEASLKEWEARGESLEIELRHGETMRTELKSLHDSKEISFQKEISQLKVQLSEKSKCIEEVNKNFDILKFNYDMLVAEKDEMTAKLNTLLAEVSNRDDRIREFQGQLSHLHLENGQLITGSEYAKKSADELSSRVAELEEMVDGQRNEILAGAEAKREVIRQLCFSLEHYRSEYRELRKAFCENKRRAVMAS